MPIFHFNARDGGDLFTDQDGSDLPDLESARAEADAAACQAVAERIRAGKPAGRWAFEITDETGQVLATVRFRDVAERR